MYFCAVNREGGFISTLKQAVNYMRCTYKQAVNMFPAVLKTTNTSLVMVTRCPKMINRVILLSSNRQFNSSLRSSCRRASGSEMAWRTSRPHRQANRRRADGEGRGRSSARRWERGRAEGEGDGDSPRWRAALVSSSCGDEDGGADR
jgi:hypothetical protein